MNSAVSREDFLRKLNKVLDATSFGLPRNPQFKVARGVISPNPVTMMDRLVFGKWTTEFLFHDESML